MGEDSRQHNSDQSFHGLSAHEQARVHAGNVHGNVHNTDVINQYYYNTYLVHKQRTLAIDRRERIGMIASIVGLIAQSDSMHTRLDEIAATSAGPLRIAKEIRNQLACCRDTLKDFEIHIKDPDLSPDRATLIPADELVTSFTNALLLFNNVQEVLKPLITAHSGPSMWYDKQTELVNLLARLWAQDLNWKMLLDILNCPTEHQAENIGYELARRIKRLLDENAELKARIESIEQQLYEASKSTTFFMNTSDSNLSSHTQSEETVTVTKWAGLSELSLADAHTMGVIGLPVNASELVESGFYSGRTMIRPDSKFQPSKYDDQLHKIYDGASQKEETGVLRRSPDDSHEHAAERKFKKGQTQISKNLVAREAIMGKGYPFLDDGAFHMIQVALKKAQIDELIELSGRYNPEKFPGTTQQFEDSRGDKTNGGKPAHVNATFPRWETATFEQRTLKKRKEELSGVRKKAGALLFGAVNVR